MANEYLQRTPTSTGNRSVWTWAGWVKLSGSTQDAIFGAYFGGGSRYASLSFNSDSQLTFFTGDYDVINSSTNYQTWFISDQLSRDFGSWTHIMAINDTSNPIADDRCKIYVNGSKIEIGTKNATASLDDISYFNSITRHYLGTWADPANNGGQYTEGELSDVFMVDGQALTPDVFGFYKNGDGYISAGPAQATDFKPGQWVPKSPSVIKNVINNSGGFGVNGFYLPMNDSSNPGADFHCDPNSIITLKGEDLPQPRNGAPVTTDAYVSQLREEVGTLGFDGCVKMDGTERLSVADVAALDLGTGDFTIEGFYYLKNEGGYHSLFDFRGTNATGLYPALFKDTTVDKLYYYVNGVTIDNIPMRYYEWMHVVICRSSGTTRAFVDGKLAGSYSDTSNYISSDLYIGMSASNSHGIYGFVSNFRIVKGTALYTTNFTPPTSPLENVTNTLLLCANSTTSATASTVTPSTITAIGDVFATKNELTGSIVLAVPGISTTTSQNFVTNGNFESDISGWLSGNGATVVYEATSGPSNNGSVKVTSNTTSNGYTYRPLNSNLEVGKRYTLSLYYQHVSGGQGYINVGNSTGLSELIYFQLDNSNNDWKLLNLSFTAAVVSTFIGFYSKASSGVVRFTNISVKQEDEPKDYSADIRGSGTNKVVQSSLASGGVGYELDGYYGSAINASDNNCGHSFSGADSAFICPGDFAVELWLDPVVETQLQSNPRILGQTDNTGGKWDIYIDQDTSTNRIYTMGGTVALTGGNGLGYGNFIPGQWNHFCLERSGSIMTTYMNGVPVYRQTYTSTIGTTDLLYLGSYGDQTAAPGYGVVGKIMDFRFYEGVAKYKGGFDVSKPYAPVGIEAFRTTTDTCSNNFATLNPLGTGADLTYSNGNLTCLHGSSVTRGPSIATIGVTQTGTEKYYWEYISTSTSTNNALTGIVGLGPDITDGKYAGYTNQYGIGYYSANGETYTAYGGALAFAVYGASYTNGDVIGVALDMGTNNGTLTFYKNGVSQGVAATGLGAYLTSGAIQAWVPGFGDGGSSSDLTHHVNFGQNPSFSGTVTAGTNADDSGKGLFKYAPPSGFLALCEDNLPTPAIADPGNYFKSVLYKGSGTTGTDGTRSIRNVGFQPDFVWVKKRGAAGDHKLIDSVRGAGQVLETNTTDVEGNESNNFTGFNSDGFDLGTNNAGAWNESPYGYVAWCWKAGGAAISNNDGTLTSNVSVNQDAGFSIVSYTANQTSGATVGHGLGKTPKMIIVKQRSGNTNNWPVYHANIGNTKALYLDLSLGQGGDFTGAWNNTSPTSSVFSLGNSVETNRSGSPYIAYCWSEIEGYSKLGLYVGNNSTDGPFVYCGFKPAWVMIKNRSTTSDWRIYDSSRGSTNPNNLVLYPNLANEDTTTAHPLDLLSNGFKIRGDFNDINSSTHNYIFMAFAETPFQTANAK